MEGNILTVKDLIEMLEKVENKDKRIQLVHMQSSKGTKNLKIMQVQTAKSGDEKEHFFYIRTYFGDLEKLAATPYNKKHRKDYNPK